MNFFPASSISPTPSPSPRLRAAWIFVRQRKILVLALVLSAALHLATYLSTPYFIFGWREPPAARYDAVLMTTPLAEPAPAAIGSSAAPVSRKPARTRTARPAPPPRTPTPKSEADFAAPENAIAVAPAQAAADDGASATSSANSGGPSTDAAASPGTGTTTPTQAPVGETKTAPENNPPVAAKPEKIETPAVELPAKISIAYKMTSSISDGVADYTWKRDGQQFEIDSSMQATGFIVGNLVGVLHQVSRGEITPTGLKPTSFTIRRGDVVPDSAEFNYAGNELKMIRANGQVQTTPLPARLQDIQSFLFQLAFDAPALQNSEATLDVMVTNARKVYRHRFRQVGSEVVRTRSGPVETLHLRSEAADPEDVYEVWLAPGNFHLPVKLKFFAGRFPVELIATSIRTTP